MKNIPKQHLVFGISILGLFLAFTGFILYQERILDTGTSVILETRPVDPRDLFRGEYVILRYAIEQDEQVETAARLAPESSKLYVKLLLGENNVASVEYATTEIPDSLDGTWIVGEVTNGQVRFPSIEQFYVPEGAGKSIEALGSELHVTVRLSNGEARAVGLLDGSLIPFEPSSLIKEE